MRYGQPRLRLARKGIERLRLSLFLGFQYRFSVGSKTNCFRSRQERLILGNAVTASDHYGHGQVSHMLPWPYMVL